MSSRRYDAGKRALDIAAASTVLVFLAPIIAIIAVAVRISLGSPILYRQMRPGRGGKPFVMLKFRTMLNETNEHGELLPDARRLTPFGHLLRSTSLDELPELLNVLRGDMSLVGPRPLLMEYLPLYSPEQAQRHDVTPGITGLAQVSGRNGLSWDDKFRLDIEYVRRRSFALDARILGLTVLKVLRREGISQRGHATMERFRGNVS